MRRKIYKCVEFYEKKCDHKCTLRTKYGGDIELLLYCPVDGHKRRWIRTEKHKPELEDFDLDA